MKLDLEDLRVVVTAAAAGVGSATWVSTNVVRRGATTYVLTHQRHALLGR